MKTNPSSYVLAAEILIIILFHAVKIRQSEKHPAEMSYTESQDQRPLPKLATENKTGTEYMLVNLVK